MSRYREWDLSCKVYVGNLGSSASKHEIESAFSKYGPLRNVWVARNPPGFAFVEFEDPRDAEDAVRGLDGTRCCGTRVRVEMSSGRSRRGGGGRRPGPRYSRSRSRSPRRKSLGRYPRSCSKSPRRTSISRYSRNQFRYLLCHRSLCKRSKLIIGKLRILPASAPSSARLPATTTTTSTTTTTTATTTSTAAVKKAKKEPKTLLFFRCCPPSPVRHRAPQKTVLNRKTNHQPTNQPGVVIHLLRLFVSALGGRRHTSNQSPKTKFATIEITQSPQKIVDPEPQPRSPLTFGFP
ncbi:RNA-binding protein 1 [Trachymyrmex zeteki]|uniref:RNA-binding protein 1 n=1 Tax=Mycetomoellerius zeteki TaxID=64791 RepID=A0A151XIJ8_9HYME|nr:RNA-binding protein 1 [Trachymyrmex zeteki]